MSRAGFSCLIVIEYEANPRNNMAEVKRCVDFLRTHLAQ